MLMESEWEDGCVVSCAGPAGSEEAVACAGHRQSPHLAQAASRCPRNHRGVCCREGPGAPCRPQACAAQTAA